MGRLFWFNLKNAAKKKSEMFWSLLFPLILATLFHFTFGTSTSEQMGAVPAALVKEGNTVFETFLEALDGETLILTEMEADSAEEALKNGTIEGIFYSSDTPSLTVAGVQINESILTGILEGYLENQRMMEEIEAENPAELLEASASLAEYGDFIEQTNINGNELNDNLSYFFALIAMACMFGSFTGMTAAAGLRADQSALAVRRSIAPTERLALVISEMLAAFTIQFLNICVLLLYLHFGLGIAFGEKWIMLIPVCILGSMTGVASGILTGSLHLNENIKIGLIVGGSLTLSFLSGLTTGNIRYIMERKAPLLNRINPSSLIADAFYSISIYESPERYRMNLILLGAITALLVLVSFFKLRRERYDSL